MSGLKPNQERAVRSLLNHGTLQGAAQDAGVSPRTLRRWMRQEPFMEEYRRQRRELIELTLGGLSRIGAASVSTLAKNLTSDNPQVAVRAASHALRLMLAGHETLDLEARLEKLEQEGEDDG